MSFRLLALVDIYCLKGSTIPPFCFENPIRHISTLKRRLIMRVSDMIQDTKIKNSVINIVFLHYV